MTTMSKQEMEAARREWTGEAIQERKPELQRQAVRAVVQGAGQVSAPVFGKRKAAK